MVSLLGAVRMGRERNGNRGRIVSSLLEAFFLTYRVAHWHSAFAVGIRQRPHVGRIRADGSIERIRTWMPDREDTFGGRL